MKTAKVKEIMMGAPVTLKPEDTLDLANDIMSLGQIRHLPILENGKLVGILSQRDLFGAAVNRVFKLRVKEERELLKSFRIDEVMHKRKFKWVFTRNLQHDLGALSISPRP